MKHETVKVTNARAAMAEGVFRTRSTERQQ